MIRALLIFGIICSLFFIITSESKAGLPAPPTGACCDGFECIDDVAAIGCSAVGGTYQGDDTVCEEDTCQPPQGACCDDTDMCTVTSNIECVIGVGGTYQGNGTTCETNTCIDATPMPTPTPSPTATPDPPAGPTVIIPTMGEWGMIFATIFLSLIHI